MSGLKFSLGGGAKRPGAAPGGIAFNLKPAAKAPQAFAYDSDDDSAPSKKQRTEAPRSSAGGRGDAPPPPADPEEVKCADKLAEFVAKNGRSFEDVTRERNLGTDGPFRFLHNKSSEGYKYYAYKLALHERGAQPTSTPATSAQQAPQSRGRWDAGPAAPAAASGQQPPPSRGRWDAGASPRPGAPRPALAQQPVKEVGLLREAAPEASVAKKALAANDSLAAMEAFAQMAQKKEEARQEKEAEERRMELLNETAYDRRRVTAVYKKDGTRGHHMQDFIPPEELAKLLSKTNDDAAKAQAAALEEQNRISADNVGHRLLQKMGWKQGQGLGADGSGITAPVSASGAAAGEVAGVGAGQNANDGEELDPYEAYRRRMQLGYQHRPNPLGNPRKKYY